MYRRASVWASKSRARRGSSSLSSSSLPAGRRMAIYHQGLMVGETPNIDRIGNEGAKFMTYYAEQSCTAGATPSSPA